MMGDIKKRLRVESLLYLQPSGSHHIPPSQVLDVNKLAGFCRQATKTSVKQRSILQNVRRVEEHLLPAPEVPPLPAPPTLPHSKTLQHPDQFRQTVKHHLAKLARYRNNNAPTRAQKNVRNVKEQYEQQQKDRQMVIRESRKSTEGPRTGEFIFDDEYEDSHSGILRDRSMSNEGRKRQRSRDSLETRKSRKVSATKENHETSDDDSAEEREKQMEKERLQRKKKREKERERNKKREIERSQREQREEVRQQKQKRENEREQRRIAKEKEPERMRNKKEERLDKERNEKEAERFRVKKLSETYKKAYYTSATLRRRESRKIEIFCLSNGLADVLRTIKNNQSSISPQRSVKRNVPTSPEKLKRQQQLKELRMKSKEREKLRIRRESELRQQETEEEEDTGSEISSEEDTADEVDEGQGNVLPQSDSEDESSEEEQLHSEDEQIHSEVGNSEAEQIHSEENSEAEESHTDDEVPSLPIISSPQTSPWIQRRSPSPQIFKGNQASGLRAGSTSSSKEEKPSLVQLLRVATKSKIATILDDPQLDSVQEQLFNIHNSRTLPAAPTVPKQTPLINVAQNNTRNTDDIRIINDGSNDSVVALEENSSSSRPSTSATTPSNAVKITQPRPSSVNLAPNVSSQVPAPEITTQDEVVIVEERDQAAALQKRHASFSQHILNSALTSMKINQVFKPGILTVDSMLKSQSNFCDQRTKMLKDYLEACKKLK